jgi:hypothetical protein
LQSQFAAAVALGVFGIRASWKEVRLLRRKYAPLRFHAQLQWLHPNVAARWAGCLISVGWIIPV